jgi:hypothetical protein
MRRKLRRDYNASTSRNGFTALTRDKRIVGWGSNPAALPENLADIRDVQAIAAGSSHALALRGMGRFWSGNNSFDKPMFRLD